MSNVGESFDDDDTKAKPKVLHLSLLQNALSKTTKKCVSSLKYSLLKQHLSAVHARDPVALQKLHEESVSNLSSNIQEELALMFKEENICELMKKLDHLQEEVDCTSNVTAWRPSGSPGSDICSHLFPVYCKHLQQVDKCLGQLQSQNILLNQMLRTQYEKFHKTHSAIAQCCLEFK